MAFTPRKYQVEAINAGVEFFNEKKVYNAIEVLPTGSGKSIVVANIGKELKDQTIVFQPSKEILQQNYAKFISYGYRAGIYSASAGHKFIDKITFATIGSVAKKHHLFRNVRHVIIDECHLVNAEAGMYFDFIKSLPGAKVLGLTATPYRLSSSMEGSMLKFLTRTRPRIFNKVKYYVQNEELFTAGHLAKLEYYSIDLVDRTRLQMNSSGSDFTDSSVRAYYREIGMEAKTIEYGNRLLAQRKNLLIFCTTIAEAMAVQRGIPDSEVLTGETEAKIRDGLLARFKSGALKCVINVGVLTTGFDYLELECTLIARSTMSLALYYQMVGRVMRPHKDKVSAWVVDLGGNINQFGKIETMRIEERNGLHSVWNNVNGVYKQLTNVTFTKI